MGPTGAGGDVVWDADSPADLARCQDRAHVDPTLPLVDAGCGNGRYTRAFADVCTAAIGIDVAASAVRRAEAESTGLPVSFRVVDLTQSEAVAALATEIGPANVFIRGVLNTFPPPALASVLTNVAGLTAGRGTVVLVENAFTGSPLAYLRALGVRDSLPPVVRHMVGSGLPVPRGFRQAELEQAIERSGWQRVESGPIDIAVVSVRPDRAEITIPGYYAVLRRPSA